MPTNNNCVSALHDHQALIINR